MIFVPTTPRSGLRTVLQEEIDRSEFKIRVVETAGRSIKSSLQRSDPFRSEQWIRNDCPVCDSGGTGRCDRSSVLYKITCTDCGDVYHGESSRSAYARCREHGKALVDMNDK